jgi:prepilin-type N-terminal cleavage/methylation domain-containing protein
MSPMSRRSTEGESGFTLVELLVVMMILGVVGSAITSVVISTMRVEQNQQQLQDVIDDGRISIERVRRELRAVRRVYEFSEEADHPQDRLRVWVDQSQDALAQPEEEICFVVEEIPGGQPGQYQLVRWAGAVTEDDCAPGATPSGEARTIVARTLIDPNIFVEVTPEPGGVNDPPTREVTIRLELEVLSERGPGSTEVTGTVRLRNVP